MTGCGWGVNSFLIASDNELDNELDNEFVGGFVNDFVIALEIVLFKSVGCGNSLISVILILLFNPFMTASVTTFVKFIFSCSFSAVSDCICIDNSFLIASDNELDNESVGGFVNDFVITLEIAVVKSFCCNDELAISDSDFSAS